MSVRTVRLDNDSERLLEQLIQATGLSISAVFKRGLLSLRDQLGRKGEETPYEIYRQLDLGPGGDSVAPSSETRRGVREVVAGHGHEAVEIVA